MGPGGEGERAVGPMLPSLQEIQYRKADRVPRRLAPPISPSPGDAPVEGGAARRCRTASISGRRRLWAAALPTAGSRAAATASC